MPGGEQVTKILDAHLKNSSFVLIIVFFLVAVVAVLVSTIFSPHVIDDYDNCYARGET